MMFFTGFTRFSSDVQKANAAGKQDKIAQLKEMLALVDDAERVLTDKNADLDDLVECWITLGNLNAKLERLFLQIVLMSYMPKAWLLVRWAEVTGCRWWWILGILCTARTTGFGALGNA